MKDIQSLLFGVFIVGLFILKNNKLNCDKKNRYDKDVLIIQKYYKKYLKRKQDKIQNIRLQNLLNEKIRIFILKRVLRTWKKHQRTSKIKKAQDSQNDDYFFIDNDFLLTQLLNEKIRIFILKRVLRTWKKHQRTSKMKKALDSRNNDYFFVDNDFLLTQYSYSN